jgi:hypothetical protein
VRRERGIDCLAHNLEARTRNRCRPSSTHPVGAAWYRVTDQSSSLSLRLDQDWADPNDHIYVAI